jgi:uncharacterized membrane protein YagU involved in acid resistance
VSVTRAITAGAVSGLAGTAPMTVTMALLHRRPPWSATDPLPPREITEELAERANVLDKLDEDEVRAATTANHFAYGAATGAMYALTLARLAVPRPVSGVAFALSIWTLSYMGWVPALRIMPPASQQPAERNAVMIASHVVWGASMGAVLALLQPRRSPWNAYD